MTNNQHLDDINTRLDDLDIRLADLGDELDLIRTIQGGVRRETRFNSQSLARLERTVRELGSIAQLQQVAIRQLSLEGERDRQAIRQLSLDAERDRQEAAADRQQAAIDRQAWQAETRRIWEYLQNRNGGSTPT